MNPAPTVTEMSSFASGQPIPAQTGERWRSGMSVLPDLVIEREIGWGGMGVVYLVTQRITGKPRDQTSLSHTVLIGRPCSAAALSRTRVVAQSSSPSAHRSLLVLSNARFR